MDTRDQIIKIVYTFERMRADQIASVLGMNTVKYVRDHYLSKLSEQGFLYRFLEPNTKPGIKPYLYQLGNRGINYLREQDFEFLPKRFNPSDELFYPTLKHNLDLNDFLIAAMLLTRIEPIQLIDFRHDSRLQHEPLLIGNLRVVPDGFLHFRFTVNGKPSHMPVWVELDEGSETNVERFKEKIRNILTAFLSPEYEGHFGTTGGTIAFATTRGKNRVETMRKWTLQVLKETNHVSEAGNFLFTSLTSYEPRELFLHPIWYDSESSEPISLLDLT